MDLVPAIEIHMSEYGGPAKDIIVMGKPGARAQVGIKNKASAMMSEDGTRPDNMGDVEILSILAFVKSAPFVKTVDAFLDYCDTLEDEGAALLKRMSEIFQELGGYSVFQN